MATSGTLRPNQIDQLLESAKNGDQRAFTRLVRHYEPFIYNSSFKVCRDREKADATARDTVVKIYRKLHQFEGDAKFTTWLYSIVVNNCLMNKRRRKLDKATVSLEDMSGEGSVDDALGAVLPGSDAPDKALLDGELREAIRTAIEKLPAEYRLVFLLREMENRPASEVAEMLDLSVPAVKSRLHRARKFLRDQLMPYVAEAL